MEPPPLGSGSGGGGGGGGVGAPAGGVGEALCRPRGSSMGGADSKVFVPSTAGAAAAGAAGEATPVVVVAPSPQQFEDAD